jgi:hypothetical protein
MIQIVLKNLEQVFNFQDDGCHHLGVLKLMLPTQFSKQISEGLFLTKI